MSVPVLREKIALASPLTIDTLPSVPPLPQPQSSVFEPSAFLGESQEAAALLVLTKEHLSSQKRDRLLKGPYLESGERLLAKTLQFKVNGEEIFRSVGDILQFYKRGFEAGRKPLPAVKLIGSSCPAFVGSMGMVECLQESLPAARSLSSMQMAHIEKYVSDIDLFLDMRGMDQNQEIAPGLLQSIEEEFWWDRAAFQVQFQNGETRQLRGFKAIVELFTEGPGASQTHWSCVNNIRALKGPDLEERIFWSEHLKSLIDAPFRDDPSLNPKNFFPQAAQVFEQLFHEPLRVFIKRTAFDEWHYFQQHQRHRMSCRDKDGLVYDFTVQIEGKDHPTRMIYQDLAVNFTGFVSGTTELWLEASDLALAHKLCRQKVWVSREKLPRDFFFSQWVNVLGYCNADRASEEQLEQLLADFCRRTPHKVLGLAEMVNQELLARKCVEQGKESRASCDLKHQIEKLIAQAPERAESMSQVIDEELGELAAQPVSAEALGRKIQTLRLKSRWFDWAVHHLVDFHLGIASGMLSRESNPARTVAFLLNASANLPSECSENDIYRLWFYLGPLIPTQFQTGSLFTVCHRAIVAKRLNPRQVFAALGLLSFEALFLSLQARQRGYMQPLIEMREGKPFIHVLVEGQTLQMPFDPAGALKTLSAVKGKQSQEALQQLLSFGKCPERVDQASPLIQRKVEINMDYEKLFKLIIEVSQAADPGIRALAHRILNSCLALSPDEFWPEALAAIPAMLHHAPDKESRMSLCDCLARRLNNRFGPQEMAGLTVTMKVMAGQVQTLSALRQSFLHALLRLRIPPFPQVAFDIWKEMDHEEKKTQAQMLMESFKGSFPVMAFEVARWQLEENGLEADDAVRMLHDLGGGIFRNWSQDPKNLQLLFDYVDLFKSYSRRHQDPPVSDLVLAFLNGPCSHSPGWMDFASALGALLPKGPLCDAAQLMPGSKDSQKSRQAATGLRTLYLETRDPVMASVAWRFHAALMEFLPDSEKREGYEEWVRLAAAQRSDLVMDLLERYFQSGHFKQDRQGAKLLLDCCTAQSDNAILAMALFRYAIGKGYWKPEDYQADFERYLKLYMTIRRHNKDAGFELHKHLLAARPEHPQLNEEMRRRRFRELEMSFKEFVPLPLQAASLQDLILAADPEKEAAAVFKYARRLLPQIDPLAHIQLLLALHRHYPQCPLEPALSRFPIPDASPEQLVAFAELLPASQETSAKACLERLIACKKYSDALNLLEKAQPSDDALWIRCLQSVANESPGNQAKAWEVSLTRVKWARFARNPHKGGPQACLKWLEFDLVQIQLLLALSNRGERSQDWNRLLETRWKAARSAEDPHNAAFTAIHFMRTRLLRYLGLLLPADAPHRYSRFFEEIGHLRNALTQEVMEGAADSPLPDLDARRMQCGLRSGNPRHFLSGLQLLAESLEARKEDRQENVTMAVKEACAFVPHHAELCRGLGKLLEDYAGRCGSAQADRIVTLLLSAKKPHLLDLAFELACRTPAQKGHEETYLKLAGRLIGMADHRVPRLIGHCAALLSDDQLCTSLCDYLDALMGARKDISDPIDPSGVALCNEMLSRLSNKSKRRCLDKALDHLSLIFEHPAMHPCISRMRTFLEELEASNFTQVPEGSKSFNAELENWLKKPERTDSISVISPSSVIDHYMQFWLAGIVETSVLVPSQDAKGFWIMLDKKRAQQLKAVEETFGSLKLDLGSPENMSLVYEASMLFVSKCQKKRAAEWSEEILAAGIWYRMDYLTQIHAQEHRNWMPHFMDWMLYSPAYVRRDFAKRHFRYAQCIISRAKVQAVLDKHPKERFAIAAFLNYKDVSGHMVETPKQKAREVKILLERMWKHPQMRSDLYALYFAHYACVTFLIVEPSQFTHWYGQLIAEMVNRKDTSWDAFNLACHLRTELKKREVPCLQEMHARHGLQILQHLCEFVKDAAHPPREDQEDKVATVGQTAWEYFTLLKKKFASRITHEALMLEQMNLIGYLESALEMRCKDPNWRAEQQTLNLMDFLYTLPYMPNPHHLQERYQLILEDIQAGPSWRTSALLFSVAKDLTRDNWGFAQTQAHVVAIHCEKRSEFLEAMVAAFEKGPLPENRQQFQLTGAYFAAAMVYVKRTGKADGSIDEARLSQAYQEQYDRAFEAIASLPQRSRKAVHHLNHLASDLEQRATDPVVNRKHRLHWKKIVEAYVHCSGGDIFSREEKMDIATAALKYLKAASLCFQDSGLILQQQHLVQAMEIFHHQSLEFVKELRQSSEKLSDKEVSYLMQLCAVANTIIDDLKSHSSLCNIWKNTVDYLCDRLTSLPILPAASHHSYIGIMNNTSPALKSFQSEYDPWLSAMSFLHAGRLVFAGCGQLQSYFEAIHKISNIYLVRGNHSPDHYLYIFKLLTDDFTDALHQEAGRMFRCTQISGLLRNLAENRNAYGQAAAVLCLKHRHTLAKFYAIAPDSEDILAEFEKKTTNEMLESMRKLDQSVVKPDTKYMMILK